MGQGKETQTEEGPTKTGTQNGKKDKTQLAKEQQQQVEPTQETEARPNPQEAGENKRPATQIGGTHKKSKAQRTPPEYTITDDDGEMIARMVQDCLSEDFDHVAHHRDRIEEKLVDMRQLLKKIREGKPTSSRGIEPSTPQTEGRVQEEERESVQAILQPHVTFHINPSMLHMDEIVGQTPLKDLSQIQLVLTRIPSGALHRLQVSVNHEVQSHARKDLTELKQATKKQDALEIVYEKAKSETQEEREHIKGLEQKVAGTYEKIPQAAQEMKSQQQKRLIRLHRKSINIRRR
jgi:hypothetical protein